MKFVSNMSQLSKKVRIGHRSNFSPAAQRTNSADNVENFNKPQEILSFLVLNHFSIWRSRKYTPKLKFLNSCCILLSNYTCDFSKKISWVQVKPESVEKRQRLQVKVKSKGPLSELKKTCKKRWKSFDEIFINFYKFCIIIYQFINLYKFSIVFKNT